MKVLVTGGAGYIGSHTTNQLLKSGHDVVVVDNLSTGFREAIPYAAKFEMGDVRDVDFLTSVMIKNEIEIVVHFAAKLVVPESIENPIEYYDNNTLGVLSLVKACRSAKVDKVVFSSTAAVYGNGRPGAQLSEDMPTGPINPYGHSKLMSESILRDSWQAYGIRTVILRYFNVAGASIDGNNGQRTKLATHLVKVSSQVVAGKREKMDIYGTDYPTNDGTCVRDYIHVEDLADIHVLGVEYLKSGGKGDIFNCGYGHGYSVKEVVDTMKRVNNVEFRVDQQGRRAGDPASLVASSQKAMKILGWIPKFDSLDLICKSAADWERKLIDGEAQ